MLRKRACWDVKCSVNAKKLCSSASKQQKKDYCNRKPGIKVKKKTDAIFVKEAKIENAAPAIRTFGSNLLGLQTLKG